MTSASAALADRAQQNETDIEVLTALRLSATASLAAHEAAADPHPGYLTPAEGDAAYQPLDSDLTAIAALSTTAYGRALLALADAAAFTALANVATAALKGLAPASGGGTTNFLRADMTWAAPGGGGTVLGSGTSIVDFGSGAPMATVTVTGQAAILAGSLVYCWIKPEATADHSAGEHIVEDIKVVAADIVAGGGFTIYALSPGPLTTPDLSPLSLLGRSSGAGQAFGKGQADRGLYAPVPGRAAVLTGKWSVGWFYTQ